MVETIFAWFVHIPVDRGCVVVLGDELNVCGAGLSERIADVGFNVLAQVSEVFCYVTPYNMKWTCANQLVPLPAGFINIFYKIGILPDGVSNNAHRISLIG
jgi:hypothetical protein